MSYRVAYGNTWSEDGWRMVNADECVWSTIPGTNVSIQLRKGTPTTILVAFAARFNALIEPLRDADTGGWTLVNDVGTSNHLAGTAMDLNWQSHPFHVAGTFGDRLPLLRELLDAFEGAVFWGGDWSNPIDEMHFQLGWPEGDERYIAVVNKLLGGVPDLSRDGLTAESLAQAMGSSIPLERYEELLPAVKSALVECDCTTLNRISMWMAQVGHESGGLQWMEEIADGSAYNWRTDLGNTEPGDGPRFKGRGPIQVTGRNNYGALSAWAHEQGLVPTATYFIDNPDELASDTYGFIGVVWYWTVARNMNAFADTQDIEGATRAVNGGLNGLADRTSRWNRCRAMGLDALSVSDTSTGETFMALTDSEQRELLDLARQQSGYRRVSRSPLRRLGEGETETISGFEWNMDGSVHLILVELLASLGHPPTLQLLSEIANADPSKYPDRQEDRKIAQAILNKLAMTDIVPKQVSFPVAVATQPEPVAANGELYSELNNLQNQIHAVTDQLAALSNSFLGKK